MDNLARKRELEKPELAYGTVMSSGSSMTVSGTFGEITALCAAGCLLRPETGDTVLLSLDMSGGAWVLSVLTRGSAMPNTLELTGDSVLRVRGGGLTVAPETELHCMTQRAALFATDAEMRADTASVTARLFTCTVDRIKSVAGIVDAVSREFTRRTAQYFRFTTEHEDCQAGSRRQLVDETLTMQSKNTVIVSEEHVKIDGELIHMG